MRRHAARAAIALSAGALALAAIPFAPRTPAAAQGLELNVPVQGASLSSLTVQPLALTPAFSPGIFDYAVRCRQGLNSLQLTLTGSGTITVGFQSGSTLTLSVALAENQAAVVTAPDPLSPAATDSYWIRCLPHDFPALSITDHGAPPGLYYTATLGGADGSSPYAMVLDEHGTPVWYQQTPALAIDVQPLSGDVISWTPLTGPGIGVQPNGAVTLIHLDSATPRQPQTSSLSPPIEPLDPHELLPLSNGDFMMLATPLEPTSADLSVLGPAYAAVHDIVDCVVQEMDPQGNLVWSWDASQHIALSETVATQLIAPPQYPVSVGGTAAADLYHCNSIDVDPSVADPSAADVLVSMRHTSAVYRISRAGTIIWKLTGMGNLNVGSDAEPVLTPSDGFSGQHDARFRPNGDITMFDDETWLGGPARGVEYSVDVAARTATDVWHYAPAGGDPAGATGSFRRSPDGTDNVVGWGSRALSGFTEVDAAGTILLDVALPNGEKTYRTLKFPTSEALLALLRDAVGGAPPPVSWPLSAPAGGVAAAGARTQAPGTGEPATTAVAGATAGASGAAAGSAPDAVTAATPIAKPASTRCAGWDSSLAVNCRRTAAT